MSPIAGNHRTSTNNIPIPQHSCKGTRIFHQTSTTTYLGDGADIYSIYTGKRAIYLSMNCRTDWYETGVAPQERR